MGSKGSNVLATNRKARHDFQILEEMEAGMILTGTEVKSVRGGRVQLKESYVEVRDGEAYLVGAHISHYVHGNRENHDPIRTRKLLLSRREIDRLAGQVQQKGLTIVPLKIYLRGSWIKLGIGLARGKKQFDKRQDDKKRSAEREIRRELGRRR